jgi:hypothetical protein
MAVFAEQRFDDLEDHLIADELLDTSAAVQGDITVFSAIVSSL